LPERGPRERSTVPGVTEVVEAIVRSLGIPPERRAEVFRAAQQVCGEELRLARTGFAPASLAELAERAVRLLPSDLGGDRVALGGWNEDAPFPEEPLDEIAGAPSGGPFGDEPDVFGAPGESMTERRVPEPPGAFAETPARGEPSDSEDDDETPEEIEFATIDRSEPRGGKLAVFLLLVAIGGGVWFFAKTRRVSPVPPSDVAAPGSRAAAASPSEAMAPPRAAPLPVVGPPASAVPANAVPPPVPAAPAIPESHGSTMLSPDWSGAPTWMIHFSSFQKKENAERDAARLAKILERPVHVVAVNLGAAPGVWFRVMLGDFGSREEAQTERDALSAKGTPGIGLVYRVEGLPPSGVEPAAASRAPAP